jgi:hypothetical protein
MITRFETLLTLLSLITGLLLTLVTGIWKARGWVDRLNTTDARLADAIDALRVTMQVQHAENQRRLSALERRPRR